MNTSRLTRQEHARAEAYLQAIAKRNELAGLEIITQVIDGNPAQAILTEAHRSQADLIVMCSHGDTGLKRWVMGSVSLHVARHSATPVLMLRPGKDAPTPLPRPVRIMVPLDGSALAEEILAPATALTRALSAPLPGMLHLTSVIPFFMVESADEPEQMAEAARQYLMSIEQRLLQGENANRLTITSSVTVLADVAHTLVEIAETGKGMEQIQNFTGCHIIAMSTHGRSGIMHWMIGSMTERVLATTKLPMLIIRPQQIEKQQLKAPNNQVSEETSTASTTEFPSWTGLL